jgi:hypothetical protein
MPSVTGACRNHFLDRCVEAKLSNKLISNLYAGPEVLVPGRRAERTANRLPMASSAQNGLGSVLQSRRLRQWTSARLDRGCKPLPQEKSGILAGSLLRLAGPQNHSTVVA